MPKISQKIINTRMDGLVNNQVVFNKSVLKNGLTIITEEIPGMESFALGITVNAGSRDDNPGKQGTAHFVEHTSFRQSKTRSSRQIATQFESLGAYTNAFTTKENTCFYVRALNPHLKKTFELLADVVFNPVFKPSDVEKERLIILEEIKSYEDDPEELIFDYVDKLLFGEHPLGSTITGTLDSLANISRDDLSAFHSMYYKPGNIVVSYAGSHNHTEIVSLVNAGLPDLSESGSNFIRELPSIVKPGRLDEKKPFQQLHILYGRRISGMESLERYPLAALNIILGDGMSSRLNQQLREKRGLAYSVYSSVSFMADCGAFYIYTGSEKMKADIIEKLIKSELDKFIEKYVSISELKRAKEQLKSSTIMALESMSARMQALVKSELTLGRYESITETISLIDAIKLDEIRHISEKYLHIEDWSSVLFYPEE